MTRRKARENAFMALFAASFGTDIGEYTEVARQEEEGYEVDTFGQDLLQKAQRHADAIDGEISSRLKGWSVQRLPKVNLAILRLAVAEMLYSEEDVDSIVINEAVELAKKFGDEADYQFINGILGSISREKETRAPAGEV